MQFNVSYSPFMASSDSQGFGNVYFIVILFILLLQLRTRRVKLFGLVVMPVLMLLLTLPLVAMELNSGLVGLALLGVGLLIGVGIGIAIGSMMEVKVDEKDGTMLLKGSILAVLVWAVIIGVKIYGKGLLGSFGLLDWNMLTSIFLMLSVGTMIARRAFVYWRYLQMKKVISEKDILVPKKV